jgi:hypothetical protein
MRGNLSWNRGGWGANALLNYSGSYKNPNVVPVAHVSSWTTVDLAASFRMPEGTAWFQSTQISLNAVNAFDRLPPFVDQTVGYDGSNASILGRLLSVQLSKAW